MASVKDRDCSKLPILPQVLQNIFDAHFPAFKKEDVPREECRNHEKKERDED